MALAVGTVGLAALALGAPSAGFAGEGVTRLANAELHVGDGSVIKNATIEIQGEEIVGVWEAGKAPSKSAEAEEIDLKGAMVTPGFVATRTLTRT